MKHKDYDNAVSAPVAIQLQIAATVNNEHDVIQSLANINKICQTIGQKMELPEANI